MNKLLTLAGVTLALAIGSTASAAYIDGSIGFTGTYTANNANLQLATSITINTVSIDTTSGDFVGAMAPFSFLSPFPVNPSSIVGDTLWTATVGGNLFSFTVQSVGGFSLSNLIFVTGTGVIDDGVGGYDATSGEFQLSFGNTGAAFTWQSTSATNQVPDGGATAGLLGAALALVGFVARRRKA